ncbi:hypothetical protein H0H93_003230, partial [Arthromyces matolae]
MFPSIEYSTPISFGWTDEYKIAASQQAYEEGGNVTTTTDPMTISTTTQDKFIAETTVWEIVSPSSDAPPNGFAFEVGGSITPPGASAVVYLNITAGRGSPAVTSP